MREESRSGDEVKEYLAQWPLVVVTKLENALLRDDANVDPRERYRRAGIEILTQRDDGTWRASE